MCLRIGSSSTFSRYFLLQTWRSYETSLQTIFQTITEFVRISRVDKDNHKTVGIGQPSDDEIHISRNHLDDIEADEDVTNGVGTPRNKERNSAKYEYTYGFR